MNLFEVYNQYEIDLTIGSGSKLSDSKGNEYIDFYGGHGVVSIGHCHPHYVESIESQLKRLGFYSNAVQNGLQKKLANKLCELSGYNDYNLFLCNSGAEANENALKIAGFHTGKKKVIAMKGAFHGRTGGALAVTDNAALASSFNADHEVVFIDLNNIMALKNHLQKGNVAVVIIEGIQGVNGVYEPTSEFLNKARELCDEFDALMILDEVQSGYGRSGLFFAHQYSGLKADIITIAKGMGNGFPVAGVLIHPNIKAKKGMLGTTFGGNHLACAAALAVLEVIEKESLIGNARKVGDDLMLKLSKLEGVKSVRGKGLMIGIDLHNMAEIRKVLLKNYGFFTGSSGANTLRLLPPLNISQALADEFVEALTTVIGGSQS